MGSRRTDLSSLAPVLLSVLFFPILPNPGPLQGQEVDRIWGRVQTSSGETHEGFIRWDRNEGSWVDQLDGSKDFVPLQYIDWWEMAHPGDRHRDRVIELGGYRITWDDDEPEFPSSSESGIRFGHVRRLVVTGDDRALLTLRSGRVVELEGGSTDLGTGLREILVQEAEGRVVGLEWEELESVEFMPPPSSARTGNRRLHGTVDLREGGPFTGFISWNSDEILTSDTLDGEDTDGKAREILFGDLSLLRPTDKGADITLQNGERIQLSGSEEVGSRNIEIQISDPGLGLVGVEWNGVERVRFHPPELSLGWEDFDGGIRLRGTVVTADSTEFSGWIRWDGDEEYSWELLDGSNGDLTFDVEFGQIASIERSFEDVTSVSLGPAGVTVSEGSREGETLVTLRDGRVLELGGSNDVDDGNDGIFVLSEGVGNSPDQEEAEWLMVRWDDFRAVRFDWEEGRDSAEGAGPGGELESGAGPVVGVRLEPGVGLESGDGQ